LKEKKKEERQRLEEIERKKKEEEKKKLEEIERKKREEKQRLEEIERKKVEEKIRKEKEEKENIKREEERKKKLELSSQEEERIRKETVKEHKVEEEKVKNAVFEESYVAPEEGMQIQSNEVKGIKEAFESKKLQHLTKNRVYNTGKRTPTRRKLQTGDSREISQFKNIKQDLPQGISIQPIKKKHSSTSNSCSF